MSSDSSVDERSRDHVELVPEARSGAASRPTAETTSPPRPPRASPTARDGSSPTCCAPTRGVLQLLGIVVVIENAARLSIPLPGQGGHRQGIPPIPPTTTSSRCW